MLSGFEVETEPLTEYELTLIPKFIAGFKGKIGAENAITNKEIVAKMKALEYKMSDARVRKIINHLRTHNLVSCLMATSKGYYITKDPEELKEYIGSLKDREMAIMAVRRSLELQLRAMTNGSLW